MKIFFVLDSLYIFTSAWCFLQRSVYQWRRNCDNKNANTHPCLSLRSTWLVSKSCNTMSCTNRSKSLLTQFLLYYPLVVTILYFYHCFHYCAVPMNGIIMTFSSVSWQWTISYQWVDSHWTELSLDCGVNLLRCCNWFSRSVPVFSNNFTVLLFSQSCARFEVLNLSLSTNMIPLVFSKVIHD